MSAWSVLEAGEERPRASYDQLAFYLVWSPAGQRPPTVRHTDEASAKAEASRLAREHPGAEFIVLQAVYGIEYPTGPRVTHFAVTDDMVPF